MQDVAKLARVSPMTVSRVLNGSTTVSEKNRDSVRSAVLTLNYVPNEVARSLRQQRAFQVGIIVPNIRDPFFAICSDAIGDVASKYEYSVVLATSDENAETEYKEATRLLRRSVDGLIVTPAARGRTRLSESAFRDFPIVAVDRPVQGGGVDCVLVHNELGASLGTKHLIEHKHRRIAHLSLSNDLYTMKRRIRGYRKSMEEAGLRPETAIVTSPAETLRTVQAMVHGRHPVTAIFCGNNLLSCQTFHALSALGLRVPEDISVVGFDDFDTADILRPALTVVRQPIEDIGRTAAELLFSRLHNKGAITTPGPVRRVLPVELVIRSSCGCTAPAGTSTPEKLSSESKRYAPAG